MIFCVEDEAGLGGVLSTDLNVLACLIGDRVLDTEGIDAQIREKTEAALYIVDDEEIHSLNLEHRGIDSATDVLSFPNIEYVGRTPAAVLSGDIDDAVDPETGHILIGDIVIDRDRVTAQAAEYGHSVKREFSFLVAHSMLHLLGYDHMTPEEAQIMEEKQEAVLGSLGITRGA